MTHDSRLEDYFVLVCQFIEKPWAPTGGPDMIKFVNSRTAALATNIRGTLYQLSLHLKG